MKIKGKWKQNKWKIKYENKNRKMSAIRRINAINE